MYNTPITVKLVRSAGEREMKVYARHGIRIRVESIAHDGRTFICTVFQSRRSALSRPLQNVQLVQHAETALAPLLTAGYLPMITAVDWTHGAELRTSSEKPDPHDPMGLVTALREAGLPFPRLNNAKDDEEIGDVLAIPFWRKALSLFAAW